MKAPLSFTFSILFCLHLILAPPVRAFDAPLYDNAFFSADGVFLEKQEEESLLGALVAISTNFKEQSRVDEDLKEKALAIALQINPLHYQSRAAYRKLMRGGSPDPTPYFKSLSSVSETLWSSASRMLKKPVEPEERKLAALLVDLSLVLHPDPPEERILRLAESTDGKPIPWAEFVILQPAESKSNSRSDSLMREGKEMLRTEKLKITANPPSRQNQDKPKPVRPVPQMNGLPEFTPISRSLPVVLKVAAINESFAAGTFNFTLRNPQGDNERQLFPFVGVEDPEAYPILPLLTDAEGVPLPPIRISPKSLKNENLTWPANVIGIFRFSTEDQLPGPRSQCQVKVGDWVPALLAATLKEATINDQFAISEANTRPDEIEPLLDAGAKLGKPYLLIRESNFEALVTYLQTTNSLERLFDSEIITYSTPQEAMQALSSETPQSLIDASAAFEEIRQASEKMSLEELSRFQSAQDRLEAIVNQFKNHGSARAMLEYGLRPISQKVEVLKSRDAVMTAIEPFLELENQGFDGEDLKRKIEGADFMLSKMRNQIHPAVRDLHGQAQDLIDVAEIYLSLSNRGTSIASQRLSAIQGLIDKMRAENSIINQDFGP